MNTKAQGRSRRPPRPLTRNVTSHHGSHPSLCRLCTVWHSTLMRMIQVEAIRFSDIRSVMNRSTLVQEYLSITNRRVPRLARDWSTRYFLQPEFSTVHFGAIAILFCLYQEQSTERKQPRGASNLFLSASYHSIISKGCSVGLISITKPIPRASFPFLISTSTSQPGHI